MGWTYNVGLEEGLQKTYTWYVEKTRNENQY
jgi:dTDP-D-glucose 4,6-dehydratase